MLDWNQDLDLHLVLDLMLEPGHGLRIGAAPSDCYKHGNTAGAKPGSTLRPSAKSSSGQGLDLVTNLDLDVDLVLALSQDLNVELVLVLDRYSHWTRSWAGSEF